MQRAEINSFSKETYYKSCQILFSDNEEHNARCYHAPSYLRITYIYREAFKLIRQMAARIIWPSGGQSAKQPLLRDIFKLTIATSIINTHLIITLLFALINPTGSLEL